MPGDPVEGAFEKRLLILSCFSEKERVLTPRQLGRRLDLSPDVVEGLAEDLIRAGYVQRDDSGAFVLADASTRTMRLTDDN